MPETPRPPTTSGRPSGSIALSQNSAGAIDDIPIVPAAGAAIDPDRSTGPRHETGPALAAPGVILVEGERVRPEEAMIFTRSTLVEEGSAVAEMGRFKANLNRVRQNMNGYRVGYSLPALRTGSGYAFSGAVKGWRATSTADLSVWPPADYPATRQETMRQASMLEPIELAGPCGEMENLRVYHLSRMVGHGGGGYLVEPYAIAFFIHPVTGCRMTLALRSGRSYAAVNAPLTGASQTYVQETSAYSAGFFGLVSARVPRVFYSKIARFDAEPLQVDCTFDRLMAAVLAARGEGPLPVPDFKKLFSEMSRHTEFQLAATATPQ